MPDESNNKKRFFHALNASAIISGGGFNFKFECYTLCGTWMGVYSTDIPEQITALEAIMLAPRSAVTEIDQSEFDVCLKKKQLTTTDSISYQSPQEPTQTLRVVLPVAGAPVDAEANLPSDISQAPVLDMDSVLKVGPVKIQ